ncbi:DUF2231 domain-containing protein [Microbacterium sp. H1-D42]|uniref:DUF2231 domain-containing protein n=1 Tax=Microbacterium sp. H1-D42 TaxID=2925844 RepID=UPI001F53AB5B|nr:DUF2231 domain-containing protein [Microbacterium sp. H1-D42]UNK69864.1 hypothetical protein MNR00_11870 [Microbacterium sp. H1-D42]
MNLFDFELAGLPLHPLLVHATVVLTPLTALALAVAALWPAARRRMGLALPIAALIVAVLVPVTILAGESLADLVGRTPAVSRHESLGIMLLPWAVALLPASVVVWWMGRPSPAASRRPRWVSVTVAAIAVAVAVVTLVLVVLTGDAGARTVWEGTV